MTYTSDRAAGRVATRGRRRQRQKVRNFRVHRSAKRVLREQAANNVEECFDVCSDRGFHCDPDINIGSGVDPSREIPSTLSENITDAHLTIGNRFSTLDSGWSSTTSQNITPLNSSFTFTSADPCSPSVQNSLTSLLLPSIPTTPPSHPAVKLPNTVSKNGPPEVDPRSGSLYTSDKDAYSSPHAPFGLPPIPSPFLYHNKSRELLQGIDESDLDLAKSFPLEDGQEAPNLAFNSYRVDLTPFDDGGRQAHPGRGPESIHDNEPLFVGAALPDMSKAVPARAVAVECPDTDFYIYTRSYLTPSSNAAEHSIIASASTPDNARSTTTQSNDAHPPILTTTNTFPRWLRTMTDVFTEPYSRGLPLTPPSKANHQQNTSWDKPGLWGPIALPQVQQQQTNMHAFTFPTLTQAAICRKPPNSRCRNTNNGCVRRMTNFWDSGYDSHSQMTDLRARKMPSKPSNEAKASDIDSAMSAFEEAMSKKRADLADTTNSTGLWIQPESLLATDSGWCSQTRIPIQLRHSALHTILKSPIRNAAIQSAISLSTLSEPNKSNEFAASPSSTCIALVPSTLYEHQYLGWPGRRTGEDIIYHDKAWLTLGACIAHLQEELASEGPEVEVATKEDGNPGAGIEKAVEHVAGHLDMKMDFDKERQYADAWLQPLASQSDFMSAVSDYGLHDIFEERTKTDGVKDPAKECFAHCAVSKDDVALSFFDQIVESPDSEISWSEIDTEDENEEDWDWSEDDLGA